MKKNFKTNISLTLNVILAKFFEIIIKMIHKKELTNSNWFRKTKGNIVITSSAVADKNMPDLGFYSMSKATLNMFTKALAQEEGKWIEKTGIIKLPLTGGKNDGL